MGQQIPGRQGNSFQLDTFTICAGLGALLIAAGVLLAIEELIDGGDYAFWFALTDLAPAVAVGVLVLLCALRFGNAPWGEGLRRATPAIGIAVIVASVALAAWDIVDDVGDTFWTPLNDLFFLIPVTVGMAVYLSAASRDDRVLGSPFEWGRILGVVALVVGIAITIKFVSDASSDEFWVFLRRLALLASPALFLLALSLEPVSNMIRAQAGQLNVSDMLNDSRLPNWIAIGGVAIIVAGILLGIKSTEAPRDEILFLLRNWGGFLGLGAVVLIASGGQVGGYVLGAHPYLRYALIAGLIAMFLTGLKFAVDADSNQIRVFLSESIDDSKYLALAYAMFEASQRRQGAAG